ncbi:transposase [Streptomyces lunaelactis]|uniref:RNA-guided endonuclease InsQ/TnpB family protein n=1 Tax=Streptomyces lunaelactis TaxID=1535768 RepID=UPI001585119E|nr:RNA-guided endonuclease TnpB family protein [Streptomyces lunaelactis]NUK09937.1 transposase [Streptomyces lunaelactis]NUK72753.1 transposase [Streptomyces lunaelactis]NUL11401.1 transposase [Streptomyces lunaelactis]NUL25986.1 transposase [Streptomyces lunaelactis]
MSHYRLRPTSDQARVLAGHCAHARYVWNLAVEQHTLWTPWRGPAPNYVAQARQLTEARREYGWLRAGAQMVQQQALRDFAQAMSNFYAGTHRRPTWRKAGRDEGFRVVAVRPEHVERLSRNAARVWVPKAGWVRFRLSRPVPEGVKSYRITMDRAGRWHVGFAAVPAPIEAPGNGDVVGVDRGVTVSAALSTGDMLNVPGLTVTEQRRLKRLERTLSRARRGSNRRRRVRTQIAVLKARETDRRKDWVERTSTDLARRFDVIGVEDLNIRGMTRSAKGTVEAPGRRVRQKAGLNRGILSAGWGGLVQRLEHKAPGRVIKINPAYSSQTCSVCGVTDREARESQARFSCRACGHTQNADVNAAVNMKTAAGRAVTAREGPSDSGPVHREPQLLLSA